MNIKDVVERIENFNIEEEEIQEEMSDSAAVKITGNVCVSIRVDSHGGSFIIIVSFSRFCPYYITIRVYFGDIKIGIIQTGINEFGRSEKYIGHHLHQ